MNEFCWDYLRERSSLSDILPEFPEQLSSLCDFQGRGYPGGGGGWSVQTPLDPRYDQRNRPRPYRPVPAKRYKYKGPLERFKPRKPRPPKPPNPGPAPFQPPSPVPHEPTPGRQPAPAPSPVPLPAPDYAPGFTPKGMALIKLLLRRGNPWLNLGLTLLDLWKPGQEPRPWNYELEKYGWIFICATGAGDNGLVNLQVNDPNIPCDDGALDTITNWWPAIGADMPIPSNVKWIAFGHGTFHSGGNAIRMSRSVQYRRQTTGVQTIPWVPKVEGGHPIPLPEPAPQPMPYPLIPHIRNPIFREAGNGPPGPKRKRPDPKQPYYRKPPKGTTERKTQPWVPGGLVAKLIDAFHDMTELGDFIDALIEGLDGPCGSAKGLAQKIACVMDHADELDVGKALMALIANAIEDGTIGPLLGRLEKAGIGLGPNGQPYMKRNPDGSLRGFGNRQIGGGR